MLKITDFVRGRGKQFLLFAILLGGPRVKQTEICLLNVRNVTENVHSGVRSDIWQPYINQPAIPGLVTVQPYLCDI